MTASHAPATEADAIAQGYKPVDDVDKFLQKHVGMNLREFSAHAPNQFLLAQLVNCNDPANNLKQCRNQTLGDGTIWVGYCVNGNCKIYYK